MPIPQLPEKLNAPAIFTAADRLAQLRQSGMLPDLPPPHTCFFLYTGDLLAHAARRGRGRRVTGFFGELFLLRKWGGRVAAAGNFGIGAPVTAVLLSDLAAWGVRRFIAIGLAGGLQPAAQPGDVVLVSSAIRDEGTSHHYLPPGRSVLPSTSLTNHCLPALQAAIPAVRTGATWSTDAPYRETAPEITRYQQEGTLAVEMEAAALFAVGQVLQVQTAACLVIGDRLGSGRWQPPPAGPLLRDRLRTVLAALLPVAGAWEGGV